MSSLDEKALRFRNTLDKSGFQRKNLPQDLEQTFLLPENVLMNGLPYIRNKTKIKIGDSSRQEMTNNKQMALIDNILRLILDIYSDKLNYLHFMKLQQSVGSKLFIARNQPSLLIRLPGFIVPHGIHYSTSHSMPPYPVRSCHW